MRYQQSVIIILAAVFLFGIIPVSANPWDDLQRLNDLNSNYPKISDLNIHGFASPSSIPDNPFRDSFISSVSNLNDPFRSSIAPPVSNLNDPFRNSLATNDFLMTRPVNPFFSDVTTRGLDNSGNSQIRPAYDDSINRLLDITQTTAALSTYRTVAVTSAIGLSRLINPTFSNDLGHINRMWGAYSLGQSTFDRLGYSTQILSPPPIDPGKYTTTQFGLFGWDGMRTVGDASIPTADGGTIKYHDEFMDSGNTMSHLYTQELISPTRYRYEVDRFYTPLQPNFVGFLDSKAFSRFPSYGYDPTTDFGTRQIRDSSFYTVRISPTDLYGYNSFNNPYNLNNLNNLNNFNTYNGFNTYNSFNSFQSY
jgi:hypothetical protein